MSETHEKPAAPPRDTVSVTVNPDLNPSTLKASHLPNPEVAA
jgi:hypothetical protein